MPAEDDRSQIAEILFSLQGKIEKSSHGMDYELYAQHLWKRLGLELIDPNYANFANQLIKKLKAIDMSDCLHKDLLAEDSEETIRSLVVLPGQKMLWSKGDSVHTGNQRAKWLKSQLGPRVAKVINNSSETVLPKSELRNFYKSPKKQGQANFGSQTFDWIVAEDKLTEVEYYLDDTEKIPKRIIVVEDSISNLDEMKKVCERHGIEFYPVWITSSREGQKMEAEDSKKFQEMCQEYNGTSHLSQIPTLNHEADSDTLWLYDFDGVLGDNIKMRERQLEVKLQAIKEHTGLTEDQEIWNRLNTSS